MKNSCSSKEPIKTVSFPRLADRESVSGNTFTDKELVAIIYAKILLLSKKTTDIYRMEYNLVINKCNK